MKAETETQKEENSKVASVSERNDYLGGNPET